MNMISFDLDYSKIFKASRLFWFRVAALPAGEHWSARAPGDMRAATSHPFAGTRKHI